MARGAFSTALIAIGYGLWRPSGKKYLLTTEHRIWDHNHARAIRALNQTFKGVM